MSVRYLVAVLNEIERNDEVRSVDESMDHPAVVRARSLADDLLISASGDCAWDAISAVRRCGFPVFPVEKDRFGWVIGGIGTRKGVVAFG